MPPPRVAQKGNSNVLAHFSSIRVFTVCFSTDPAFTVLASSRHHPGTDIAPAMSLLRDVQNFPFCISGRKHDGKTLLRHSLETDLTRRGNSNALARFSIVSGFTVCNMGLLGLGLEEVYRYRTVPALHRCRLSFLSEGDLMTSFLRAFMIFYKQQTS